MILKKSVCTLSSNNNTKRIDLNNSVGECLFMLDKYPLVRWRILFPQLKNQSLLLLFLLFKLLLIFVKSFLTNHIIFFD